MATTTCTIKVPTITVAWLKQWGACAKAIERFTEMFGGRAEVTRENLRLAVSAGLNLDWLAERILPGTAWAAYKQATAAAWAAYKEATATALANILGLAD